MANIMLVSPENRDSKALTSVLEAGHHLVENVASISRALLLLQHSAPDLVICETVWADSAEGEAVGRLYDLTESLDVLLIAMGELSRSAHAAELLKRGAFDYLVRPVDASEAREIVGRALSDEIVHEASGRTEEIRFEALGSRLIIWLPEHFDHRAASNLVSIIDNGLEVPCGGIAVDMSLTRQVSSMGVGALHLLAHHCQLAQSELYLVGASPRLRQILEIAGICQFYKVVGSINEI